MKINYYAIIAFIFIFGTSLTFGQSLLNKIQLTAEEENRVQQILGVSYMYECTDVSIKEALNTPHPPFLAKRLHGYISYLLKEGYDQNSIVDELEKRAMSMLAFEKSAVIDQKRLAFAGKGDSTVTLIGYICSHCPFCRAIIPKLYDKITKGTLSGKVKFAFRLFPIKGHKGSVEGALAIESAHQMEKGWPYFLHFYKHFDEYDPSKIEQYAISVGLKAKKFKALMGSQGIRNEVVASKKEGRRNDVRETPTFFINGKKYMGRLKLIPLIDALEEEHDDGIGTK